MDLILIWSLVAIYFAHVVNCDKDWWKHTAIYEVYIRSFKDSNGDGIGDLNGVASKLDHFVDIGIETIWITPFYKSPMVDNGYDVQDYREVDPLFGTMSDFDKLLSKAKKLGLKIMVDFVPNHTSNKHEWFQKSIKRIEPYTNYYIWKDPKNYEDNKPVPPNNWISRFGGPAWKFNEERKQFYYHMFGIGQPDLNYLNPVVREEMLNVIRFWLKKGVDGIRYDATPYLLEDPEFRDESYNNNNLIYTRDLKASYELLHEWRVQLDKEFQDKDGYTRLYTPEAYASLHHTMDYYDRPNYKIAHFPFNFFFVIDLNTGNATEIRNLIHMWTDNMPSNDSVASWSVENHDNIRLSSKYGREFVGVLNVIITMLPGVPTIFYGQEIGLEEPKLRPDQLIDFGFISTRFGTTRDRARCPMQWDESINAGFSTHIPWLPVTSDYWKLNAKSEKQAVPSFYNTFKKLMKLRKLDTLKYGELTTYVFTSWTFVFTRTLADCETIIVVTNLGSETETFDLSSKIDNLPKYLEILAATENAGYRIGSRVSSGLTFNNMFTMRPKSALVLTDNRGEDMENDTEELDSKKQTSNGHVYQSNYVLIFVISLIMTLYCKIIDIF